MAWGKRTTVAMLAATVAGAALAQPAQRVTGPIAVYWMSATTTSGFSMGAMGGGAPGGRGGIPDIAAMMGGAGPQHTLLLQLGSSRKPAGDPAADHRPPAGLKAGDTLPLVTPRPVTGGAPAGPTEPSVPQQYQKPNGKMLIYWGCGERAPQGQPVEIDFASMTDPAQAQRLAGLLRGLTVQPMEPPSPSRNATYGEWPNERSRTTVPSDGSLVGPHTVKGNYSPDISFTIAPNQDFLAPITLTTNDKNPGGWVQLGWNAVPNALGYFATVIGAGGAPGGRGGGGDGATVVLWSSSQTQVAAFLSPDFMSPAEANRLVQEHALLSPQTTTCNVYREVAQASPSGLLSLTAYGDEANFSYPARPTDRTQPWNIEWEVKVRYKSTTGGLLGMQMPNLGGAGQTPPGQPQPAQQPPARPSAADVLRGLGGIGLPRIGR